QRAFLLLSIPAALILLGPRSSARQPAVSATAPTDGKLTIDALIDIKHPSNPVWSRDSRRVAFMWERAGVANLFVVPADGAAAPVPITKDGDPVAGVFWSADSRTLYFMRGGMLMRAPADRSEEHTSELQSLTHLVC